MPPSAPTTAHAMPGSGDPVMLSVRTAGVYSARNHTTRSPTAYSGIKTSSQRRTIDCSSDPTDRLRPHPPHPSETPSYPTRPVLWS